MEANTKPLPREEWDFYKLDKQEVPLAFYYEYGRTSEYLKSEVAKMRAARPKSHPNFWPYPALADNVRLDPILRWLAERELHFPKIPWLTIRENAIEKIQKERTEARRIEAQINATLPPGQKFCAGMRAGEPGDPVPFLEWIVTAIGPTVLNFRLSAAGFSHVWMGSQKEMQAWHKQKICGQNSPPEVTFELNPEGGIISGGVNWRATDEEILERFAQFLERERPPQFKANAITRRGQRGFDISFPFRPSSALQWLGVFRRRSSTTTWRQFFSLYKNGKFSRGAERAYEEDCRKTKLILAWFDKGTPLRAKDFK